MQTLLIILMILASILLSFFVLIQNPKGGGLSAGFGGGSNLMGVKRTGDFLEKGTWTLLISIIVFALALNVLPTSSNTNKSGRSDMIESTEPAGLIPGLTPGQEEGGSTVAPAPTETPVDTTN